MPIWVTMQNRVGRRAILGAGVAAAFAGTLGVRPALAEDVGRSATPAGPTAPAARRRAYAFLDAAMDAYSAGGAGYPASGQHRLAQSYTDQSGLFSTAFVYDNALAILAYLADDRAVSRDRAVALGDALIFAQAGDPDHDDGRLRQAYSVGPYTLGDGTRQPWGFVRPDGTANVAEQFGFLGTTVGDMAWPGLALAALYPRTGARRFRDAAVHIGEWIQANAYSTRLLGGYTGGVDGDGNPLPYGATEHNIDCVAFFGQLARLTGQRVWLDRRAHADAFVTTMYNRGGGFFYTGTDDGVTISRSPVPEDVQTWSFLATGQRPSAVDYAAGRLAVRDTPACRNSTVPAGQAFDGVTFSTAGPAADEDTPIAPGLPRPDRSAVWFEGTAHLAAALRCRGGRRDRDRADSLLASIEKAQDVLGSGQTVGGRTLPERAGVVSSSSPLDTGYAFGYYPYRHVGATAWYLLAKAAVNPLR